MSLGKLILLPNLLDPDSQMDLLPSMLALTIASLQGLICESDKEGRRFLRKYLSHDQMAALPLKNLNEHTQKEDLKDLLSPLLKGERWGLISDAGLPCIADPGAELVWLAREQGIEIEALSGPCSLLLALQLSGFSGQSFSFHGYLPRDLPLLEEKIKDLEKKAKEATQIWIEAPYRSAKMADLLQKILQPATKLCIAVNLTGPRQRVASSLIKNWKPFPLEKEPAVFLLSNKILDIDYLPIE
jgi:16S rRNA (cytidine1402-2'-O)-methyltransferase